MSSMKLSVKADYNLVTLCLSRPSHVFSALTVPHVLIKHSKDFFYATRLTFIISNQVIIKEDNDKMPCLISG